jgi:hypothetical protein
MGDAMGMKGKTWLVSCLLLLVLFMSMSSMPWAQENMCVIPTGTASVTYPENWGFSVLKIYTSDDEVGRGQSVEVWVESDSHGCPPYQWQASGTGFHFNNISGPPTAETYGDGETLQLWAESTACGSAVIMVVDGCGADGESSVREPNYGYWQLIQEEYCATIDSQPGGCDCDDCSEVIVGGFKYMDCWFGGTTAGYRYHGPTCTKWPYTEDKSNSTCGCAGFYYDFNVVGLYKHFKWQKMCN